MTGQLERHLSSHARDHRDPAPGPGLIKNSTDFVKILCKQCFSDLARDFPQTSLRRNGPTSHKL